MKPLHKNIELKTKHPLPKILKPLPSKIPSIKMSSLNVQTLDGTLSSANTSVESKLSSKF